MTVLAHGTVVLFFFNNITVMIKHVMNFWRRETFHKASALATVAAYSCSECQLIELL
jgi:hypothetical protein